MLVRVCEGRGPRGPRLLGNLTGGPILLLFGPRDLSLSGTPNIERQLLRAGVSAQLVVFDVMPHVHSGNPGPPESHEALGIQAKFMAGHVSGP